MMTNKTKILSLTGPFIVPTCIDDQSINGVDQFVCVVSADGCTELIRFQCRMYNIRERIYLNTWMKIGLFRASVLSALLSASSTGPSLR